VGKVSIVHWAQSFKEKIMKLKTGITVAIATFLMGYHLVAAAAVESKFKLAVVKDAPGASELKAGDVSTSLYFAQKSSKSDPYEQAMTLCVAKLTLGALDDAKSACTEAVNFDYSISSNDRKKAQLKAFAYNNRAIVHYMASDVNAAMADFNQAIKLADESSIKANFNRFIYEVATSAMMK
jgi:tetratricopeptide (TPR) repeat protein